MPTPTDYVPHPSPVDFVSDLAELVGGYVRYVERWLLDTSYTLYDLILLEDRDATAPVERHVFNSVHAPDIHTQLNSIRECVRLAGRPNLIWPYLPEPFTTPVYLTHLNLWHTRLTYVVVSATDAQLDCELKKSMTQSLRRIRASQLVIQDAAAYQRRLDLHAPPYSHVTDIQYLRLPPDPVL